MDKLWAVISREYMERVRSKWFVFATVFGPVLFAALLILPPLLALRTKASDDVASIVILDATGAGLGDRIAAALPRPVGAPKAAVRTVPMDSLTQAESTVTREVMRNETRGYLVLDTHTIAGERARYAGRNASSIGDMEALTTVMRQSLILTRLSQVHVDSSQAAAIAALKPELSTERLSENGRAGSGIVTAIAGFSLAFLLYMSIILYGQTVLRGVIEEKNTRVAEVVVSSVSTDILLAGKVLGVGAVGMTQQIVWFASGIVLAKLRAPILSALGGKPEALVLPSVSPGAIVVLVLFFVLGYVFYSSLFAAVGAMVSNEQDAQQAATPVILLLVTPMLFLQTILLNPSSRTAEVLSWIPFSAPIIMPLRMVVTSVPWYEVALTLGGVLVACAGAIWLAARIYRVGLLMYGKRPSLGEVARWVGRAN